LKESDIMRLQMLALSSEGHVPWRNNTGMGWIGQTVRVGQRTHIEMGPNDVLIRHARPLYAGLCIGSGDIVGVAENGLFFSIESKTETGRQSAEQKNFEQVVHSRGGIYAVARDPLEAIRALKPGKR
jgi:hypothetical protein